MPWETETLIQDGIESIFAFDYEKPDVKFLVYKIDIKNSIIEFYPKASDNFLLKKVIIEGFSWLPKEFAAAGYITSGVLYYLNKKLEEKKVIELIISKTKCDSFRKIRNKSAFTMVLSYASFQRLKKVLTTISSEAKRERSSFVNSFFNELFPTRYRPEKYSGRKRALRLIESLDQGVIEFLKPKDIDTFLDFFKILLDKKYSSINYRRELFYAAKIKIDDVALNDVIKIFENLLIKDPNESDWGDFLEKNLFLIESKYIRIIPQLNVVLATTRKVDFGLVDSQGYLDLFEIKKPSTKILASNTDRGNYYWSTDAIKSLVQAEKYLFNLERKASTLVEDINRELGIDVKVVRPRVVVILGHSNQLDNNEKKEDFRILRMSLKNVEVVLYDELLERIKNQRNKIYLENPVGPNKE